MELTEIRKKIDHIDLQLVKLMGERLEWTVRTKRHKKNVLDPEREKQVLAHVKRLNSGLLREDYLQELFVKIIAESHRAENLDLKLVGFQGEHGAYSEMAALKAFPTDVTIPFNNFRDVFENVASGSIDLGIVPVENSTEGMIAEVHDLLMEKELFICGEIDFAIHHQLLTLTAASTRDIRVVYSHPQALAQCRRFIERRKLEAKPFFDTAGAARWLMEKRSEGAAVIASNLCANLYGLETALENIEDEASNATRFLLISREASEKDNEISSIIFSSRHQAGALYHTLATFAQAEINLTRIESRPVKNDPGHYRFFVDLQGAIQDPRVERTLENIRSHTTFFKFLGSYRRLQHEKK
jgi:prephenate dehydratase/chorismate mutase